MKKIFIPLCKNTSERYYFNIMIFITIIYHIYIEIESYQLAYRRSQNWIFHVKISNKTMGKWKYNDSFTRYVIVRSLC